MPMNKPLAVVAGTALLGTIAFASPSLSADAYNVDPDHTSALFFATHFGYSKVIGRFNKVTGELVFDEADVGKSSVKVTINTSTVDTNQKARDKHLRSPDFFNAAEFPTMTFVSTKVEKTGDKTGKVTGNLTLLGVTKPVILNVTFNRRAPHPLPQYKKILTAGFSATTKIKRSDFGMKKFIPAIGDEIEIILQVEAAKK